MKDIIKDFRKIVLMRRIISFYFVVLFFILFFLIWNNMYIKSEIEEQYDNSNEKLIREINKDITGKLQYYKEQLITFTVNNKVLSIIYDFESDDEHDVVEKYRQLIGELGNVKAEYIVDCHLVIPNKKKVLSSDGLGSYERYKGLYNVDIEKIFGTYHSKSKKMQFYTFHNEKNGEDYLFMLHSFRDYLLLLELDKVALERYLSLTSSNITGSYIFITKDSKLLLSSQNKGNALENFVIKDNQILSDQEIYEGFQITSGYDLTYHMVYDNSFLGIALEKTNYYTMLLSGIFLLLIFVGVIFSFLHLKPIKNLFNIIGLEDNSGKNELRVMEKILLNIRDEQESIQEELKKYYELNRNLSISANIFAHDEESIIHIQGKAYTLLYVIAEKDLKRDNLFINELEDKVLSKHRYRKVVYYMKPQLYVIYDVDSDALAYEIKDITNKYDHSAGIYIMSLSSPKTKDDNLKVAYQEVTHAINNMPYCSGCNIFILNNNDSKVTETINFSIQDENNFVQHVFHGNKAGVESFFYGLKIKTQGKSFIGIQALYKYMLNMAYIIVSNNTELRSKLIVDMEVNNTKDLSYYHNYLMILFMDITSYYTQEDMTKKIESYIRENYNKYDLGLTTIADAVGLTPTYLANYYKKETNSTIKKCIDRERIQVAIQLLTDNKSMKIEKVAKEAGIENIVTFNRVFKKYVGMTPTQYRNK